MKTAVSLPDELFDAAEAAARRLGLTRSGLYARAIEVFLREHAGEGVTDALDAVHGEATVPLDPVLEKLQSASIDADDDW